MQQALELDYTLDEAQLAEDWASLLTLASQPGSSLEQLHIFVLAHVLRRPIVIYGVKYVKSWRGENLGYARFEGKVSFSEGAFSLDLRSADKELKAVTPEK